MDGNGSIVRDGDELVYKMLFFYSEQLFCSGSIWEMDPQHVLSISLKVSDSDTELWKHSED